MLIVKSGVLLTIAAFGMVTAARIRARDKARARIASAAAASNDAPIT